MTLPHMRFELHVVNHAFHIVWNTVSKETTTWNKKLSRKWSIGISIKQFYNYSYLKI